MLGKLTGWGDTIVALATPPGVGAIGVIRVSGPKSIGIVSTLFAGKDLSAQASHTLHVGLLKDGEEELDEAVVSLFRAPRSYTGEDVIEISCHGSPIIQQKVIGALLKRGARPAKAGEFTQRAFLNGKMDLTQAEAVADLIASESEAAARTALHTIRGGFSRALRELRERLISFSALIELELDFSQEDVEFADRTQLYHLIEEATQTTAALLQSFRLGNVIKNGVSVAIVGKPNAGKSTLLNALLNEDRAIVSEIAGTTRDTIEEVLNIGGIIYRLIDTAGIRQHTSDTIEQMGVGRSLEKMEQADIVLYLFDVREEVAALAPAGGEYDAAVVAPVSIGEGVSRDAAAIPEYAVGGEITAMPEHPVGQDLAAVREDLVKRSKAFLLVGNKVDLAAGEGSLPARFPEEVLISARDGRGMEDLKQRLVDLVLKGETAGDGTMVTNARHYQALQKVAEGLVSIQKGLDDLLPGDLLALDIRHCLHYLGEITGEITTEDQLDYIFSKFCIGK
ncbi:MAG TPA: tRNA uridine-5-carboxymethylaminomethyl(34) synthesis GTPase MnmE [Puia sp.]|nr:tRNA uridine-5-carboxymethylaminomethyl(34) synthesis GTPase MnmE [Puia sp.]